MAALLADLTGRLPSLDQKLDLIRELLSARRKDTFTVGELAGLTGRSSYTVRRWIAEGRLSAIRIAEGGPRGRLLIPRAELERLISTGQGGRIPESALDARD
jgi:excisionase family DNA binding protein